MGKKADTVMTVCLKRLVCTILEEFDKKTKAIRGFAAIRNKKAFQ